jgi:hypothetical protein
MRMRIERSIAYPGKNGRFTGFDLAASPKAVKRTSEAVTGWHLRRHANLTWEQLTDWIGPVIRRWTTYYGRCWWQQSRQATLCMACIRCSLAGACYLLGQNAEATSELEGAQELPGQASDRSNRHTCTAFSAPSSRGRSPMTGRPSTVGRPTPAIRPPITGRAGQADTPRGIGGCMGSRDATVKRLT